MKKEDLLKALKVVLPGVDKKDSLLLEGANTFVFDKNWVKTFNDHLSISFPLKTGLNCAVRAKEFYSIINKMGGPELKLSLEEGKLMVQDETTILTMTTLKERIGEYIDNFHLEEIKWFPVPSDFFEGLSKCVFSAATDPIYGALNSIFVGEADVISSDNYRVSWFSMKESVETPFLLSIGAAKELIKLGNMTDFSVGDAWIHFMNDSEEATFSCRRLLGEFPSTDIKALFDGEYEHKYCFPDGILQSLIRTSILAYEEENPDSMGFVLIYEEKGKLICRGERGFGSVEDSFKIPEGSFPKKIKLNIAPAFLQAVLSSNKEFFMKGGHLVFKTEKYHHLITTITPKA